MLSKSGFLFQRFNQSGSFSAITKSFGRRSIMLIRSNFTAALLTNKLKNINIKKNS